MQTRTNRRAASLFTAVAFLQCLAARAEAPIMIDTRNVLITVDATACRWSAEVKRTPMRLNDVHFLPGDDPAGWTVVSSVDNNDVNDQFAVCQLGNPYRPELRPRPLERRRRAVVGDLHCQCDRQ